MKRLVLVDGSALVFRAYFAIPANLATTTGLHTNAIYGFANTFRKLFDGKKPDFGAVVFDSPAQTFREKKYPQYKAQRPSAPGDLTEQFPWINKVVDANRFPRLQFDGYEADDVIGTLAKRGVAAGMEVVIVSGDKDFAQLIDDGAIRMFDPMRDVTYDAELVRKKWGVAPSQIVDLLALMGDSVDNIPGVPGIGQKGASTLLEKYGSIDGIYQHLGELKGKQKSSLEAGRESATLSRELATIDCDADLGEVTVEGLAIELPDRAVLNTLYKELEFYSLLDGEGPGLHSGAGAGGEAEYSIAEGAVGILEALAPAAGRADAPIAVVPMFDLPSPITGALAGVAFCREPGRACYVPFAGAAIEPLKTVLGGEGVAKVTHDAKGLWQLCERNGIALRGRVDDTMLASFLVEPTKLIPHRLDQVAREYVQRTLKPLKDLTGGGQSERAVTSIPAEELGPFACHLADAIASAWPVLAKRMDEIETRRAYEETELPLAFVLGRMELDGVKVDPQELAAAQVEFAAAREAAQRKVYELAGHELNLGSTKQLGTVLFDELKLPVVKRTKTGYSTDSEVLEKLAAKHEIARFILEFRKFEKLINTYTEVLTRDIDPRDHRVHATFQQTVGASGRIISTEPDLQRTPVRTPEGKRIRKAFVAEPGNKLISADWSQIELRLLAHVTGDPKLVEAYTTNADIHRQTAAQLFHVPPGEVTKEQRNVGKTVNFATIYGQGATALAQQLGIPRKEAEGYIARYFETYSVVREWIDRTVAEAKKIGYVTTLGGRRRFVPELYSQNPTVSSYGERIAANTPIQGSAADLCKQVMLAIARRLDEAHLATRMLVQIHDELLFEAPPAEVEPACALVKQAMEHTVELAVPLVAEVGVGDTWADAH